MNQKIKDLNLLLLFLSSWEEESRVNPEEKVQRSWKGYLFDVLQDLEAEGLITQRQNTMSVIITQKGIQKAKSIDAALMNVEKAS